MENFGSQGEYLGEPSWLGNMIASVFKAKEDLSSAWLPSGSYSFYQIKPTGKVHPCHSVVENSRVEPRAVGQSPAAQIRDKRSFRALGKERL